MKKFKLFAASLGLMTLAACSNTDDVFNGAEELAQAQLDDNAIKFGTYMGQGATTRAGWAGDITNTELQDGKSGTKTQGFGVFAYYTGTVTYNNKNGATSTLAPNFMYNEQVYYDASEWKYDNIKYWPNEIQNGAVDVPGATTDHANGGKVSFFAYAPYVASTPGTGTVSPSVSGITAMTTHTTTGDPILTYAFAKTGKNVDLLWGTYGSTSKNVLGTGNAGVKTTETLASYGINNRPVASRTSYSADILRRTIATSDDGYVTNADLVKQENDGKVDFAFKHALSMVGGSSKFASTNPGLGIVLDADAIVPADADANTVVSVEDIKITTLPMAYVDNDGVEQSGTNARYITGGTFNLATGKWTVSVSDDAANKIVHELTRTGTGVSGSLNEDIAEPAIVSNMNEVSSKRTLNGTVNGVTGTVKAVYGDETSPMLFIPGTKPKFEVEITYYVRSFDGKLNSSISSGEGTWTKVKQTIKKTVEFTRYTELNKRYALLIHLGITSVKFTATVSDWETYDRDGSGSVTEDDYERIDLPLNVN